MAPQKVGIIFIVIGILSILSFLIYPRLSEKNETTVPVLKYFSDSGISESSDTVIAVDDDYEIWGNAADKSVTGISQISEKQQSETASFTVFPIDINVAAAEELMQIKGIGRVTADDIILYRENHGYFYSIEDLLNVDRIGEKKLENIRDYIYVNEALLSETVAAAQETVPKTVDISAAVTTVPITQSSISATQTSIKTKVTSAETDDIDDGRIIEEITDFEEAFKSETTKNNAAENSFFDVETTSEEYRPNFPLELNTASVKDLTYIKGVGETLAWRIVEYARNHGFYDVNDLLNVSGIGQSKLNDILPYVYVDTSGLPPKAETTASNFYNDIWETSDMFQTEMTAPAVSEIYRVNINTASKADFMQLSGIDEALADNIISLRNQIGGFANIEELSLAEGMTNSKLSVIWNYIYI